MKKNMVLLLALIGLILVPVVVQQASASMLPRPETIVSGSDANWNMKHGFKAEGLK